MSFFAIRAAVAAAVTVAVAVVAAAPAQAHAVLEGTSPSNEELVDGPVEQIELFWNENVEAASGGMLLVDEDGNEVGVEVAVDGSVVTVTPLEELTPAAYQLDFQVISEDTHPVGDTIIFRVMDAPDPVEQPADDAAVDDPVEQPADDAAVDDPVEQPADDAAVDDPVADDPAESADEPAARDDEAGAVDLSEAEIVDNEVSIADADTGMLYFAGGLVLLAAAAGVLLWWLRRRG